MKKIYFIITIAVFAVITSCSGTKRVSKSIEEMTGTEVVVSVPLRETNTEDTKDEYRGVGNGTSADWTIAKNIAMTNARGELATKIEVAVRQAIENYAEQVASNSKSELVERVMAEHFEQYTITYVDVLLSQTTVLESVTTRNSKTFEYTYWVAIEVPKSVVVNETTNVLDTISEKDKRQIKYDRDEFRNYLESNYF